MKKINKIAGILSVFLVLVNTTCKKDVEPYEIGVIIPSAPESKEYGANARMGIEIGFEEINMIKGVRGKMLKAVYVDAAVDESLLVRTIEEMFKRGSKVFISLDRKATEIVCSLDTTNSIILFSDWKDDVKNMNHTIYAITPRQETEGKLLGKLAVKEFRSKKAFLLLNSEEERVTSFADGFEDGYSGKGKGILNKIKLSSRDRGERKDLLELIKNFNVDLVVIAAYTEPSHIIRELRESGHNNKILVPIVAGELLQKDYDIDEFKDVFYAVPDFDPDSKKKIIVNFQKRFKEKYGKKAGYISSVYYDLAEIIAYFLEINGDDVHRIHRFLGKVRDYRAVTGNTSYYPDGEVVKPIRLKKIIP